MFLPQLTRYLDIKKLKGKYIQIRNSLYRIAMGLVGLVLVEPITVLAHLLPARTDQYGK